MKKVFSTSSMVAHVWAQRSQSEGRTPTENIYFNSDALYSYGSHFPLAKFLDSNTVLINGDSYSVTTSKQQSEVRSAIPSHYTRIYTTTEIIKNVVRNHSWLLRGEHKKALIDGVSEHVKRVLVVQAQTAAKRRKPSLVESDINVALSAYDDGEKLLHFYKAKMPVAVRNLREKMQSDLTGFVTLNEAQLKAAKRKHDKEQAKMRAEKQAKAQEYLPLWLACEPLPYGGEHCLRENLTVVMLRVNGDEIETTLGARFPVSHGKKAFTLIRDCKEHAKEWKANGHTLHLGNFAVDAVEADGTVKAGCHVVPYSSIEPVAKALGLI